MSWFLSPSGWPTFADSDEETTHLQGRGYDPLDETQVQAAIDAFNATVPPTTQQPGYALAADVATALALKANAASLPGKLSITDIPNPATPGGAALRAAFGSGRVDPTDVGYDILVFPWQSNTIGRATDFDAARIDISDPRVFQFGNSGNLAGMISLAAEPLAFASTTGMGVALGIGRLYAGTVPVNRRVLLVVGAVGGTPYKGSAPFGTWDHTRTDATPLLPQQTVAQVKAAVDAVHAQGLNARVTGIFGIHGETDAENGVTRTVYAAAHDEFIDWMRGQLAPYTDGTPIPVINGGMVADYISSGTRTEIRQAQIDTPRRKLNTAYADGVAGMSKADGFHYNAAGQRAMQQRMFVALARAKANVLGAPPLPPIPGTTVQTGTSLTLNWSAPVARVTDYGVRYRRNGGAWATLTRAQSIDTTATIDGLTLGDAVDYEITSVNEQGTSAPAAGAFTLVTLPAQVTGLTAGAPTYNSLPVSWSAAARATSYLVQYRVAGGSSWTTALTTTATSATVTGLADGVSYDVQVIATNGAGQATGATTTASTLALSTILDALAATAWSGSSVRKLRAAYTGAPLRVRRDSDNTEQDIPFLGSNLDTAALLAFVGSGNGYVTKMYDQGTNGTRHQTQTTQAYQPQIVSNGAVLAMGTVPAPRFDGVDDHLFRPVGLYAAGAASLLLVLASINAGVSNGCVVDESRLAGNGGYNIVRQANTAAQLTQFIQSDSGTSILATTNSAITPAPFNNAPRQISVVDTGSSFAKWVDGTAVTPLAYTRATTTPDVASVGARNKNGTITNPWPGMVPEIISFTTAISDDDRALVQASQKAYFGTP